MGSFDSGLRQPQDTRVSTQREVPSVVIVGGGFGGLKAATRLAREAVRVTLLDKHNYHLFQPLLYQVATAGLSPADIASPLRSVLRSAKNVRVLLEEATSIDVASRVVRTPAEEVPYDALILAAGARHSYFGHPEWEAVAPGLKTLEDALEIRRRVLLAFERAETAIDDAERKALLTFVVVGGGPTGVELAGAIAEIAHRTIARDFRRVDPSQAKIVLLEGGPQVLASYPESLAARARRDLERMGVEVRSRSVATLVTPDAVFMGEERIPARTVLWAAGMAGSPIAASLGVPLDRAGRVIVKPDLSIPGHPEVFVIGDLASFTQDGVVLAGVAQVAMQQGVAAAENAVGLLERRPTKAFRYLDLGTMATIGRASAVAVLGPGGRIQLAGYMAWLAWVFLHVVMLINFRSRVLVMVEWIWAYLTFGRGARLITGPWKVETPGAEGGNP